MKKEEAQRYLAQFEALDELTRRQRISRGADPDRAVRISLSMLDAAGRRARSEPASRLREESDDAVRTTWNRLRASLCRDHRLH
jgi:hypothetical protein